MKALVLSSIEQTKFQKGKRNSTRFPSRCHGVRSQREVKGNSVAEKMNEKMPKKGKKSTKSDTK